MENGHSDLHVGIDLGTTNSVIATCSIENKKLRASVGKIDRYKDKSTKKRDYLLPSCVYYQDEKGEYIPVVGDYAKTVALTQPYAVSRSVKTSMGQSALNIPGWKKEYPDQTPEKVSSRILKHMLKELEDHFDEKIDDVIITIPASFNSAQSEATLYAAKLAGINTKLEGGAILLPEPEAVIYNVLNEIHNGDIDYKIDFSENKKIMVFDIGGGTLDITLHDIKRRQDNPDGFDFKPLATNRFSTVAGDVFDEALSRLLYEKYINYYERQDKSIAARINEEKYSVMNNLAIYAEELKIKINNKYNDRLKRGKILKKDEETETGGFMPSGYNLEDTVTLEEFENCLAPLLGGGFSYDDYKQFSKIKDDRNIIYPILDVLSKAAKKLGTDNIQVDEVIMNGGMSRLYLIKQRLTEFFGFKPIEVSDPDTSVAQGAAVYHYYLHEGSAARALNAAYKTVSEENKMSSLEINAVSDGVLNESIYLGLRGGAEKLLAESGQDIPFSSGKISGFSIPPGEKMIRIPIKQKNRDGIFETIAAGNITFRHARDNEAPVSIQFNLRRGNIMSIYAWTSYDPDGEHRDEIGLVTLQIGDAGKDWRHKTRGKAMIAPTGTVLVVQNELYSFKKQVWDISKCKDKLKKEELIAKLSFLKTTLLKCGNPEDFAEGILKILNDDYSAVMAMNLLPVARTFSAYWTDAEKNKLSRLCLNALFGELAGLSINLSFVELTAYKEAILTIGDCGVAADCEKLRPLMGKEVYENSLLYAFGQCGIYHSN